MDARRWQRLQDLFEEATELDQSAREPWLQAIENEDAQLASELRRLLAADQASADQHIGNRIQQFAASTAGTDELCPGQAVGPYTIDRLLGHGGMGRVYLAHRSDQAYEQQVVIKVVQAGPGERLVRLFERERQILAKLNHPNIARLLDGGTLEGGTPYLVMEYVEGADIVRYCEQSGASLQRRLRLFLQVCAAVQYAHAQLVVHRDIKPANVLVDASNRVRLLDFGIATLLTQGEKAAASPAPECIGAQPEQTLSAALLSPAHASPEQLRGEAVTTGSDIYTLGRLLYRLVCGRSANTDEDGQTVIALPSAVLAGAGHRRQSQQVAGDLDAIILRALAHDPQHRHPTVAAFSTELERFLNHLPVDSRPASRSHRLSLFARRNPALSAALIGTTILVTGLAIGMSWLALQLSHERDQALAARATTDHVAGF
ncbi:MAG: serine/threonine-protein kinase, partial [Wenzhouxiangella sp.]